MQIKKKEGSVEIVKCPYCNNENINPLDEGFDYVIYYCSNCNDNFTKRDK